MQTQIAVFTAVVPLHLRGGALWCTFQWLVKENFCNWTQKQEKKTCVCKTWMHHSCHEGSQNRLKRRVLQKRISAKDAAQTGLVQNIFSFPRATVDPNCNLRARLCFPGKRSNWGKKKSASPRTSRQTMGFLCQRWFSGSRTLDYVQLFLLFHF